MFTCRSGVGSPASAIRTRPRDSATLSARPSENATARPAARDPGQSSCQVISSSRSSGVTSPACSAASIVTTADSKPTVLARSTTVRAAVVTCTPPISVTCPSGQLRDVVDDACFMARSVSAQAANDVNRAQVHTPDRQPVRDGGAGVPEDGSAAQAAHHCARCHRVPALRVHRAPRIARCVRATSDPHPGAVVHESLDLLLGEPEGQGLAAKHAARVGENRQ